MNQTIDGKIMDASGQTKETISLSVNSPETRRIAAERVVYRDMDGNVLATGSAVRPPASAVAYLVYIREINDESEITEQLHSVCATKDDAIGIADALCDLSPEWAGIEEKAFAESVPFTTFAAWSRGLLVTRAKAKLTPAEWEALREEMREK